MSTSFSIQKLSTKFIFILVLIISSSAVFLFAIYAQIKWKFALQNLHDNIQTTSEIHLNAIAHPLHNDDREALSRNLQTLALHGAITCVEVTRRDQSSIHRWPHDCRPPPDSNFVTNDVVLHNETVGNMRTYYATAQLGTYLKRDLQIRGLFFILLATIGAISSYATLQWIVGRPVSKLMASISNAEQDNIRKPVEWSSSDELGSVISAYNSMLRQIDDNNRELVSAREQAEAAAATKNRFLTNMSHELRTPLNAVIGITEMLREEAEDGNNDTEPYERISRSGRHLLQLIDDLLDYSKIEAGKIEMVTEQVQLLDLLDDVISTTHSLADEHGNKLELEYYGQPATLATDPLRLRQILINLLGNACKFTENGSVTLSVTDKTDSTSPHVRFCVSDTGIGIAPERREHLFEDFSQADTSITRNYGGTGLGLAISQRLCRLLGGEISVSSTPGQGSRFSFELPA